MTGVPKSRRLPKPPPRPEPEPIEEEPLPSFSPRWTESLLSFFVSIAFHSAVLMFLAIFVYSNSKTQEPLPAEILNAEIEPEEKIEELAIEEVEVDNLMAASDDTDSSQAEDARELANASDPPPVKVVLAADRGVLPADVAGSGNGFGGNALSGLGETAGSGNAPGNGDGQRGDGEVGFFGAKDKGDTFVFIVDCSGSMTTATTTYNPRLQMALSRFVRARQELYLSLGQLGRAQKFYVIFYNSQTFPMFYPQNAKDLMPATPNNLGLARSWIQQAQPGGGTEPQDAFKLALALRPQVIFFLTDGAIPGVTRKIAKEHNVSRTRIHTIAFGTQNNEDILKGIAQDNQGRFRFVP